MSYTTVAPELPNWILDTFEGRFIKALIPYVDAGDGLVRLGGDTSWDIEEENARTLDMNFIDLLDFIALGRDAGTPLTIKIANALQTQLQAGEYETRIDIHDLSERVNYYGPLLEIEDFFHSLCSRFPEQIPFVETAWAFTDRRYVHGNFGGGAAFVTPSGIDRVSSHGFLEERRRNYSEQQELAASLSR